VMLKSWGLVMEQPVLPTEVEAIWVLEEQFARTLELEPLQGKWWRCLQCIVADLLPLRSV